MVEAVAVAGVSGDGVEAVAGGGDGDFPCPWAAGFLEVGEGVVALVEGGGVFAVAEVGGVVLVPAVGEATGADGEG